jgi:hypothetical protein
MSNDANVVQSAVAEKVVQPQPGVPEASNWTQQLYEVGQEVNGPPAPAPIAHAHVMPAVSSWQDQPLPEPPAPPLPVVPPAPPVPVVDWQSGRVSRQFRAAVQSVIATQLSTALLMAAWFEQ